MDAVGAKIWRRRQRWAWAGVRTEGREDEKAGAAVAEEAWDGGHRGGGRGRPPTEEKAGDVRRLQAAAAAEGIDVKKKKTGSIRRIGLVG
jgi:hypothetical protein